MKRRALSVGQQILLVLIWLVTMIASALILLSSRGDVTIWFIVGVTIPYIIATLLSIPITRNPRGPEQRW